MSQFSPRRPRHVARYAVAVASIGVAALSFGPIAASASPGNGSQSTSETTVLPLNSGATAPAGSDCPTDGRAYWHFVVTPNDGSLTIESITLNLDGTQYVASGSLIVQNGSQTDNVFVAVPAGYSLDDLVKAGTSATVSGDVRDNSNFNLSHICEGSTEGEGGTTTTTAPGGGVGGTTTTTAPGGGVGGATTTTVPGGGGTTTTTVTGGGVGGETTTTTTGGAVEGETINRSGSGTGTGTGAGTGTTGSAEVMGATQTPSVMAATAVQSGARYTG